MRACDRRRALNVKEMHTRLGALQGRKCSFSLRKLHTVRTERQLGRRDEKQVGKIFA